VFLPPQQFLGNVSVFGHGMIINCRSIY